MPKFQYQPIFERGPDQTEYRHLTSDYVTTNKLDSGRQILEIAPEALQYLAKEAMSDMAHLLRSDHLAQLRKIIDLSLIHI